MGTKFCGLVYHENHENWYPTNTSTFKVVYAYVEHGKLDIFSTNKPHKYDLFCIMEHIFKSS